MKPIPIKPSEVKFAVREPVLVTLNDMIKEHWDGTEAKVERGEFIRRLVSDYCVGELEIENNGWLKFRKAYEEAGWIIETNGEDGWTFKKAGAFKAVQPWGGEGRTPLADDAVAGWENK